MLAEKQSNTGSRPAFRADAKGHWRRRRNGPKALFSGPSVSACRYLRPRGAGELITTAMTGRTAPMPPIMYGIIFLECLASSSFSLCLCSAVSAACSRLQRSLPAVWSKEGFRKPVNGYGHRVPGFFLYCPCDMLPIPGMLLFISARPVNSDLHDLGYRPALCLFLD